MNHEMPRHFPNSSRHSCLPRGPTKSRPEQSGATRNRPELPGAVRTAPGAARMSPGHRPDAVWVSRCDAVLRFAIYSRIICA